MPDITYPEFTLVPEPGVPRSYLLYVEGYHKPYVATVRRLATQNSMWRWGVRPWNDPCALWVRRSTVGDAAYLGYRTMRTPPPGA